MSGFLGGGGGGVPATHDHSGSGQGPNLEQSVITGLSGALSGKADASHPHTQSDVTGLTSALSGKAASSHSHASSDITNFATDVKTAAGVSTTPDTPPASPNAMDDEFEGTSLDAKWTWVNQESATATVAQGVLAMVCPLTGDEVRGIFQTLPAGAWECVAKVQWNCDGDGADRCVSLMVRESASDKITQIMLNGDNNIKIWNWNSTTSYSSTEATANRGNTRVPIYFRIADDAANITFSFSFDGIRWQALYSRARTTFLTADQIGVGAGGTNVTLYPTVFWFRRTG